MKSAFSKKKGGGLLRESWSKDLCEERVLDQHFWKLKPCTVQKMSEKTDPQFIEPDYDAGNIEEKNSGNERHDHDNIMTTNASQHVADIDAPPPAVKPVYAQYDSGQATYSPAQTSAVGDVLDRYPTHLPYLFHWCISDADYRALATSVALAIKSNILPSRIPMGSSGSYLRKGHAREDRGCVQAQK